MYENIGINLSKTLDNLTKRVKVPAITQRDYFKDLNNMEEEYIKFYKLDCNNIENYKDDDYSYLDLDENDCEQCSCDEEDYEECIDKASDNYKCCIINKFKNVDSKIILGASIGALVSCIGIYFILRKR